MPTNVGKNGCQSKEKNSCQAKAVKKAEKAEKNSCKTASSEAKDMPAHEGVSK